jgi:hypothetical protein
VALADLDGDGDRDVVLGPSEGRGRLSWYEHPGARDGAFRERPLLPSADGLHGLQAADMDGDCDVDLVFAESGEGTSRRVGLLENRQQGASFAPLLLSSQGSHNVRVGDADGDGDLDVLGSNPHQPPIELWRSLIVP